MKRRNFLKALAGVLGLGIVGAKTVAAIPKPSLTDVGTHVISRSRVVPDTIIKSEVLVPTFEIASNPTIKLSEIKARRFYIVDRAQIKAKEAIQKEEDQAIFNAIAASVDNKTKPYKGQQELGRRLFMVDELPQGAYARYEKDYKVL